MGNLPAARKAIDEALGINARDKMAVRLQVKIADAEKAAKAAKDKKAFDQKMVAAQTAFDAGKLPAARAAIGDALKLNARDKNAVRLQTKIAAAEKATNDAQANKAFNEKMTAAQAALDAGKFDAARQAVGEALALNARDRNATGASKPQTGASEPPNLAAAGYPRPAG